MPWGREDNSVTSCRCVMVLTISIVEMVLLVLVTGLNFKTLTFLRLFHYSQRFLVRLQPNKNVRRFSQ